MTVAIPTHPPVPTRRHWLVPALAALLLGLHAFLALRAAAGKSVTADELFHVTGGYLFNRYGDYRIHPDNGVLPQRLHALPAVLGEARPPRFAGNEYWRTSDVHAVGYQFFYESGNDHWPMLMGARAMNCLFSLGAGLLVFMWARRLAGDAAGLTALGLLALSPTWLAHGALATSDAAAALLLTASAGAYGGQLRQPSPWRTAVSAVVFGLACVAKFSAVLLLPVLALLTLWHFCSVPPGERRPALVFVRLAVHGGAAMLIIWAFYGFRYAAFAPGLPPADHFIRSWDWMLGRAGWQASALNLCRTLQLLPEGFLFGYTHAYVGAQTRGAFLAGEYSVTGWVEFFPLAFLWKSTPAELGGIALALAAAALHWRRLPGLARRIAPLLVLTAVYGGIALTSHLNIGHRHLLPLYPALCIVAGAAAVKIVRSARIGFGLIALLVAGQGIETARIHPHYLAYFNGFAGGPANGWRLLVDSSLDWGQDLAGLSRWLNQQNQQNGGAAAPVFLSYFGSGEPAYYKLDVNRLPFLQSYGFSPRWYELTAGFYCVSATMLQQVYSPLHGPWTAEREREYQEGRLKESLFREYWRNPAVQVDLHAAGAGAAFEATWQRYDLLRFARLCHYLRARKPDATIGYSIFVHRLSQSEVDAALHGSYSEWLGAIDRVSRAR